MQIMGPNGIIAGSDTDCNIHLWNMAAELEICTLSSGHIRDIQGLTFSLDGKLLISWSRDRTIKLWRTKP